MKRLMIGTAALGIALGVGWSPAGAQVLNDCTGVSPTPPNCLDVPPEVQSEQLVVDEVAAQQVTPPRPAAQTLPVTGGDVVGLAAIGGAAVAAGAGLMVVRRRKAEA